MIPVIPVAPQDDELTRLWIGGLADSGLMDEATYLSANPDVAAAGMSAAEHYVRHGAHEGRPFVVVSAAQRHSMPLRTDSDTSLDYLQSEPPAEGSKGRPPNGQFVVYASALGNHFFTEIAELLAQGLRDAGFTAATRSEQDAQPTSGEWPIVVAPHEFFLLGAGRDLASAEWLGRAAVFNTEQMHTSWFSLSMPALIRAGIVLSIDHETAQALRHTGANAHFLPLVLSHSGSDAEGLRGLRSWGPAVKAAGGAPDSPWAERPVDIAFIGTLFPRRERFFAGSAERLAGYRSHLHLPKLRGPLQPQGLDTLSAASAGAIARRTKVLLNIHQSEQAYFEWHRIVCLGMLNGAVVLSEPCSPVPGLVPGVHYLEADLDHFPDLLDELLLEPRAAARAETMRQAAWTRLRAMSFSQVALGLANLFEALGSPAGPRPEVMEGRHARQ